MKKNTKPRALKKPPLPRLADYPEARASADKPDSTRLLQACWRYRSDFAVYKVDYYRRWVDRQFPDIRDVLRKRIVDQQGNTLILELVLALVQDLEPPVDKDLLPKMDQLKLVLSTWAEGPRAKVPKLEPAQQWFIDNRRATIRQQVLQVFRAPDFWEVVGDRPARKSGV